MDNLVGRSIAALLTFCPLFVAVDDDDGVDADAGMAGLKIVDDDDGTATANVGSPIVGVVYATGVTVAVYVGKPKKSLSAQK